MSKVRMQSRYWMMTHEAIAFYIKKEEIKLSKLLNERAQIPDKNCHAIEDIENEIDEIRKDIRRYEAMNELFMIAANKPDGMMEKNKGLGPDYVPPDEPEFEEETPEDEFKWRTNDSIGY